MNRLSYSIHSSTTGPRRVSHTSLKFRAISSITRPYSLDSRTNLQITSLKINHYSNRTCGKVCADKLSSHPSENSVGPSESESPEEPCKSQKPKTIAELDQELQERLEQMSGGGGASGIEYEDGKPQTMKRSVRNNMFRYI